jgi:HSP20 family protein
MPQQETQNHTEQNQASGGSVMHSQQTGAVAPRPRTHLSRLAFNPLDVFRISPFALIDRMVEEMDLRSGQSETSTWTPAIEVAQKDGVYSIRAEIPGVKPEDMKVELSNDAVILEGERVAEREEKKDGIYRSERLYGRFYRSIPLPEGADADQARARFENGVLEVTVPVQQQAPDRRSIPIETTSQTSQKQ